MKPLSSTAVTSLIADGGRLSLSYPQFELKVVAGPHKGLVARSTSSELLVGSAEGSDLVLGKDSAVSRNHFTVRATEEGFELKDLGSRNGTWLADVRVKEVWLTGECVIAVGHSKVRFVPRAERVEVPLSDDTRYGELVGKNPKMRDVFSRLRRVAPTELAVLVEGESGTGKELAARAIHEDSLRAAKPYEIFDCAAVAPAVLESELFGHEKGAFTGATSRYRGVFERADRGTLFLDEIGELRPDLQPKLLRVLEAGEFRRVGGAQTVRVDVRVIAATNRDLRVDVNRGQFRLDLYFRLASVRIRMPSLAERADDIPLLVSHFAKEFAGRHGVLGAHVALSEETIALLTAHHWPGNVRELRNFVEQSLVLAELAELPTGPGLRGQRTEAALSVRSDLPYKDARELLLSAFTEAYFTEALRRAEHNISRMARETGIDRVYAQRVIKKLGLKASPEPDAPKEP